LIYINYSLAIELESPGLFNDFADDWLGALRMAIRYARQLWAARRG